MEPAVGLYLTPMWNRDDLRQRLQPPLIGMIHLPPLPGAPDFGGDLDQVIATAVADLAALVRGGIRAAMVENFHDSPFWPDRVPPVTIAAMAVVLGELRRRQPEALLGVNVLRNDAEAALALAATTGAAFIRVNVHTGAMLTDQGPLQGQAHLTLRRRRELGCEEVGILADVRVKHATPLAMRDLVEEAADLRGRGKADAVILSGPATGAAADPDELRRLRAALPDCPLLLGSGVTGENLSVYLDLADGCIVGSSLQIGGRIDADRTAALVAAAARLRGRDTRKERP